MALKEKRVFKPKLTPEELKALEENIAEFEQKVVDKKDFERQKRHEFMEETRQLRTSMEAELRAQRISFRHATVERRKDFERTCRKGNEELRVIKAELAALKRRLKSHYHYPRKQEVIDNHFGLVHVK